MNQLEVVAPCGTPVGPWTDFACSRILFPHDLSSPDTPAARRRRHCLPSTPPPPPSWPARLHHLVPESPKRPVQRPDRRPLGPRDLLPLREDVFHCLAEVTQFARHDLSLLQFELNLFGTRRVPDFINQAATSADCHHQRYLWTTTTLWRSPVLLNRDVDHLPRPLLPRLGVDSPERPLRQDTQPRLVLRLGCRNIVAGVRGFPYHCYVARPYQ